MKFLALAVLIFASIIAGTFGSQPCDYDCSQDGIATCAYNGQCYLIMDNQCALQKYNCLNPQRAFRQVDLYECKKDSSPQCQQGDY